MPKSRSRRKSHRPARPDAHYCEAEVIEGLEAIAREELITLFGQNVRLSRPPGGGHRAESGVIRFRYSGPLRALLHLRTVRAVYLVRRFDVARPRALLGDMHFRSLLTDIARVRRLAPPEAYHTLHLSAAGSDSAVMIRIKDNLAQQTGLRAAEDEGDLLLRIRPAPGKASGWDVLIRLSPRPLATRPWRVCSREGALNATIAHAMILMTDPRPNDVFLNLACGSGTLLIERLSAAPARHAVGCDTDPEALACAQANLKAAGYDAAAELHDWDARALPLPEASVDALCADLPFGHLVGSHEENVQLYPQILAEAARVARPGALFALITHEIRLMESLLADSTDWQTAGVLRVTQGGLHPRIFVLHRERSR